MPSVVLHLFGIRGVKQSSNRCVYTKYAECVTIHREENKAVKGLQPESAADEHGWQRSGRASWRRWDAPWTCRTWDIRRERRERLPPIPLLFLTAQNTPLRAKQDNLLNCKRGEGKERRSHPDWVYFLSPISQGKTLRHNQVGASSW